MTRLGHCATSPVRLVFNALRLLDTTTADQLSIYTGLTLRKVTGVLRQYRHDWCELIDYVINRGRSPAGNWRSWETGIWQYTGPETLT